MVKAEGESRLSASPTPVKAASVTAAVRANHEERSCYRGTTPSSACRFLPGSHASRKITDKSPRGLADRTTTLFEPKISIVLDRSAERRELWPNRIRYHILRSASRGKREALPAVRGLS